MTRDGRRLGAPALSDAPWRPAAGVAQGAHRHHRLQPPGAVFVSRPACLRPPRAHFPRSARPHNHAVVVSRPRLPLRAPRANSSGPPARSAIGPSSHGHRVPLRAPRAHSPGPPARTTMGSSSHGHGCRSACPPSLRRACVRRCGHRPVAPVKGHQPPPPETLSRIRLTSSAADNSVRLVSPAPSTASSTTFRFSSIGRSIRTLPPYPR